MNEHQKALASRLGVFGQSNALSFLRSAIPVIVDWIAELAAESLPPREVVLGWAETAINYVLESTDFPAVDDRLIDPIAKRALLSLAGRIYDAIAAQPPVI